MQSLARSLLGSGLIALVVAGLGACTAGPAAPTSPVDGVVTGVDAPTLDRVDSFTLRLDSGDELTFGVEPGDPDVTATDLREHRNFGFRLRVFFTQNESGARIAERAEHAEG